MNKAKRVLQQGAALGVIGIGVYMFFSFAWPTPPAISGLGFFLAGLALWVPHCPVIHTILGDKHPPQQNG